MRIIVAISVGVLLGFMSLIGVCQEGWIDHAGRTVKDTDARKTQDGFGGWIVVTSDADWRAKWNTSPSTIPRIAEAKAVERGQKVFVLIFFWNPIIKNGKADVTCDIDVTRPDGTNSIHQLGATCFSGLIKEDPHDVFLSVPVIQFTGEPRDPPGVWVVDVRLRDNARASNLPLKTSFKLEE
jgi:hypothetical protein